MNHKEYKKGKSESRLHFSRPAVLMKMASGAVSSLKRALLHLPVTRFNVKQYTRPFI